MSFEVFLVRPETLTFIRCLRCDTDSFTEFSIKASFQSTDGHILEGYLTCPHCHRQYPIVRGIPRFLSESQHDNVINNVANFGEQWKTYCKQLPQNKIEFESYFQESGMNPEIDFQGKTILDAGCGSGKFAAITGTYPNISLLGIDLSESVDVAFEATRHLSTVHIIQGDILNPPLKPGFFDLIYSIGVLHHTYDPPGSFKSLSRFLKPAGEFFFWLYAKEGNQLYLNLFDPIRANITRHFPVWLNNMIAWIIAIVTWPLLMAYATINRLGMLGQVGKKYLPLFEYLCYFHTVGFWLWRNTILDKMIPHIAYHYSKQELLEWLDGFKLKAMTFRNGNSWGVLSEKLA